MLLLPQVPGVHSQLRPVAGGPRGARRQPLAPVRQGRLFQYLQFNTIQTVDNIYAVNIYCGILRCLPAQLAVPADHGGPEDGLLPGHLHPAGGGHNSQRRPLFYYYITQVGALVTIMGFLGCCGAWKQSAWMLGTFFAFLFIIFLVEIGVGIMVYFHVSDMKIIQTMTDNCY